MELWTELQIELWMELWMELWIELQADQAFSYNNRLSYLVFLPLQNKSI